MITFEAVARIRQLVAYLEANQDDLIIDADTHPSHVENLEPAVHQGYTPAYTYYHGRPISTSDLLMEMEMAGVDMSLIWQNPAALQYTDDPARNYEKLLAANAHILHSFEQHPTRFIPAGWTDPKALGVDNALKLVEVLMLEFGFCIVKMNPAQNAFPIDSGMVLQVVDRIVELGGIPTFHYGADTPYTPPEGLEVIAKRHPNSRIIAVHMGGGGAGYTEGERHYLQTRELGLKYPNLFFPLSARRDTHTESDIIAYQLAGGPFAHNLACASDAPYGRQTWNFGGYHKMLDGLIDSEKHPDPRVRENPHIFDKEMKKDLLGRNMARFALQGFKHFLEVQGAGF